MINALASLSDSIAALAAAAAPWLITIRTGPNAHLAGVAYGDGLVVTTDRGLAAREHYSLLLQGGHPVSARLVGRESRLDLALLRLGQPHPISPLPPARKPATGSLVLVLGTALDATPTVRVAVVHRLARNATEGTVLDLHEGQTQPGALVLDSMGAMLGIARVDADGIVSVVPHGAIVRFVDRAMQDAMSSAPMRPAPVSTLSVGSRRGWFGIALQPITVPETLVPLVGQASGRLVVGITTGGPADAAGLRVGDVLLSLGGRATSGTYSLRAFLDSAPVGDRAEARVLRDASVITIGLTVAEQP